MDMKYSMKVGWMLCEMVGAEMLTDKHMLSIPVATAALR